MLFKDEVRALGESLGIPHELVWRQPFPGPGLAIRVLGDVTEDNRDFTQKRRHLPRGSEERRTCGSDLAVFYGVYRMRTVGVMGDQRTYDYIIGVRAVTSTDAMTVEWAEIPYPVLSGAHQ